MWWKEITVELRHLKHVEELSAQMLHIKAERSARGAPPNGSNRLQSAGDSTLR